MAFNVTYSFNNGAVTGTATSITALRKAIYNYAHSGSVNSSSGSNYSRLTQCALSGTIEGNLICNEQGTGTTGIQYGVFNSCSSLTNVNLSNLDTSNVTIMDKMFSGCSALTSVNLSNLDTSNVTGMQNVFLDCYNLTSLDISSWNTSSVTNASYMFSGCSNLEHIYVGSSWNTNRMSLSNKMFNGCTKLPNYNSSVVDKTNAHTGAGGYLEKLPEYIIQLKHNERNAFPKVAVDGTTIVDNNGILSTAHTIWSGTEAQYNAIATKNANTIYLITG